MKTDCFETFFKGITYEDDYDYNEREQHIIKNKLGVEYTQALNNRIALSILGLGLNAVGDRTSLLTKIHRVRECLYDQRRQAALRNLKTDFFPKT